MDKSPFTFKTWLFLGFLLITCCVFYYCRLTIPLTFESLKTYQQLAQDWATTHYSIAIALYLLVFTTLIASAIPCASILTLIGGLLFGPIALLYAIFSTTVGGLILFFAARTALGSPIAAKKTGWIKRMEKSFQQNAFNYLLLLRLIPIFPCWISNIGAGALNVPLATFISATIIGIFPSTLIYVLAGRSIDKLLADDKTPLMTLIFTPSVLFSLLGLAILSLFPVIYNGIKMQRDP